MDRIGDRGLDLPETMYKYSIRITHDTHGSNKSDVYGSAVCACVIASGVTPGDHDPETTAGVPGTVGRDRIHILACLQWLER